MTVWFFSTDANGSDYRFDIASPTGGKVSLPVGNYKMLTVNNDAKTWLSRMRIHSMTTQRVWPKRITPGKPLMTKKRW